MWSEEHRLKAIATKKKAALDKHKEVSNTSKSNHLLKKLLLTSGVKYECVECGIDSWKGQKISLELDHIDGQHSNNSLENLRLLCPNCHSLTKTFRGRNINNGHKKVSDELLLQLLKESPNIRQALIKAGLSPRGANYSRALKLLHADVT